MQFEAFGPENRIFRDVNDGNCEKTDDWLVDGSEFELADSLFRERALLDTAPEKNGTIGVKSRGLEKSRALMRIALMPFGPKNRAFGPKGTKREKQRDCVAEDAVESELLSALTGKFTGNFSLGLGPTRCKPTRTRSLHKLSVPNRTK